MQYTEEMGLKLPEGTDNYNVDDFNYNFNILDGVTSLAYNESLIQIVESGLIGKELTATNVNDNTDVYKGTFDSNGKLLLKTGIGTYNLTAINGLDLYIATVTTIAGKKITVTLSKQTLDLNNIILGFDIDEDVSNPRNNVTYTDDMEFLVNNFDVDWVFNNVPILKNIKPCILNTSGVVTHYLDKDDYSRDTDGNSVNITSGDNVMVEFPKMYWYIYKEDNIVHFKLASYKVNNNYKALAHLRGTSEQDKIYIGAYLGYLNSSTLKSWSGRTPTASKTSANFRSYAQANGTNYQKMTWYMYLMLEILFVLKYKSTDCQTALGRGYVDGNSAAISTGNTDTKGFNFGETTGKQQMKFMGIEDVWGNLYQFIDGLYTDGYVIKTTQGSFADFSGSNITSTNSGLSTNTSGYITKIQGTTETGFLLKAASGSETTFYCDSGYLSSSCLPVVGGGWSNGGGAGLFFVFVDYSSSFSAASAGSRIAYL